MIALFLFYIHILGWTTAFTKEFQKDGWSAGLLTVGFMVLIFTVGWSITTFLLKYIIDEKGFGIWFTRDTLSLLLLTIGEASFYYFYFRDDKRKPVNT